MTAIQNEDVDLKKAGQNYKGLCPFHSEKIPSFVVNPKKQIAHCFGCGWHGDVISFIQKLKGLSFQQTLSYLNIDGKPYKPNLKEVKRKELLQNFRQWCADYYDYLCSRVRWLWRAKQNIKSIEEAEALSKYYHLEPLWLHRIETLQSSNDEMKFQLYEEWLNNEEV